MIPVNEPLLNGNESKYLLECIETGWISSEGPFITRFEREFAASVSRRHAIAVANGSMALDAGMMALGLEEGSEVILPSFTIISCAAAIVRAGCVPVAVDSDPLTWNIDPTKIEAAITPKTRAIMVVHIYGLPCDMAPINEIARRHNLKIIEDAAEMHGQTYNGQPCGSFGDVSIFSFYPNKHITTGEGGMIVTDSDAIADRSRSLRNLCFLPARRFVHEELGWNMRMTNMQAALGCAQLERLPEFVERKRAMGSLYTELLQDLPGIQLPLAETSYARNIYWVYGIVLKDEIDFDAAEAMKRLAAKGVGCRPFFWPMHEQPVLQKMGFFKDADLPIAARLARRGFYIPSGMALREEQIREVAGIVAEVIR
ncbi:DegT/DnrJ/EryC1/StrS family aminotransferase [Rhizobium lentis]|uniref:DegT/DnrJ/EryC1/StrS family aminotransferase n=1 Tax=Rhizobium lentis TaxID=1138194 RepID=A0A9Q3QXE6_9HYPH|nr:DegT/DnrJ/EryC1/StrS family aminotransferase [Rhizobium lentis]MBX5008481.1 DegT/DnrJ/EryC1/StrS family aminotransferase [Rhizobium lentis]MBX5023718.1 DegT/DnrJ/EryC1/StrS family aminotransferase [Rhizobium lentis]MBX5066209.1 DegT/DnrJ/EryC1/StrS family aminotransferase [Rhizobium lentis]MBX5080424.1 DegT/DnrJ/EryC1/StrS family aminotransferase [Rhizobium lentis]QSW91963.1 DegT/DnrJ/EryC1/StrS family aminotransferase [Rhizobium lentis]